MPQDFSQDQLTRSYAEAAELDARAADVLGSTGAADMSMEAVAPQALCDVWQRLRPIIEGASNLFLIPANIRAALKLLISLVDGLCRG